MQYNIRYDNPQGCEYEMYISDQAIPNILSNDIDKGIGTKFTSARFKGHLSKIRYILSFKSVFLYRWSGIENFKVEVDKL